MSRIFVVIGFLLAFSCNRSVIQDDSAPTRLITLGGTITEITSALGCQHLIVGRDVTSVYPESIDTINNLGHRSQISLEGILSSKPTIIISEIDFLSADMKRTLVNDYSIDVVEVENNLSTSSTQLMIKRIGEILDKSDKADSIINQLSHLPVVKESPDDNMPSVLFVYARGAGSMQVAGQETFADALIKLAGAKNAASNIKGFRPLSSEALITINPDFLLFFTSGYESLGGEKGIQKLTGVKETNAGKNSAFIHNDASLLGNFGPRLHLAVAWLESQIKQ